MKLLSEEELIWTTVVANNRMNRSRNASGINSYAQEFGIAPGPWLQQRLLRQESVAWTDLCCGEGKALLQTAAFLAAHQLQQRALLTGIDLVAAAPELSAGITCVQFREGAVLDWAPAAPQDLITCVHGLHYVGDRLQVIQHACAALKEDGLFLANINLQDIRINGQPGGRQLIVWFQSQGLHYSAQKKILRCEGPHQLELPLHYEGADAQAGPNYTGQPAVQAYYRQC